MATEIDISFLQRSIEQKQQENDQLQARITAMSLKPGGGGDGPSDLLDYRVTEIEKRFDRFEGKLDGLRDDVVGIRLALASLSTKDTVRGWAIGIIVAVIATGIAVGGLLLQSSSNQLAAFQSGLSAIQAVTAAESARKQ